MRIRSWVIGTVLFLVAPCLPSQDSDSLTSTRAAFLMNAETGEVIYQKEPDLPLPPASTTKVMTSILALESGRLDESFFIPKEATLVQPSKINLRAGESVALRDLVYSLLLNSANDASIAVAVGLSGSVEKFAELMTAKAAAIGAHHTQFKNPHGLTEEGHVSTARDLALIFQYALRIPSFRDIAQQKDWSIPASAKHVRTIRLRNHNRLLWEFDGVALGKTGFTLAAQRCFVGSVSRDGTELIVSVLGSRTLWADTKRLLELGFDEGSAIFVNKPLIRPRGNTEVVNLRGQPPPSESRSKDRALRGQKYSLQLASFQNQEKAQNLKAEVSQKGYRAVVEKTARDEGLTWYRVRVGSYPTLAQARNAARRFKRIIGYGAIVVRSW